MKSSTPLNYSTILTIAALAAVLTTGCGRARFTFENDSSFGQLNPPTVCAPFDPANPGNGQTGLTGSIRYLDDNQSRVTRVDDLISSGHDAGVRLVLNRLDVPTVAFTHGFVDSETGTPLKRSTGEVLNEWFSIDLRSQLSLTNADEEGFYQLALLSDDGAVLEIDESSGIAPTKLIDNDGTHPTRMGCGVKAIYMKRGQPRAIRLKYFQGPRHHIALMLVWRKVSGSSSKTDATCCASGNDYFWNSAVTPSVPTDNFAGLVERGWKTPAAQNYLLPANELPNPCL